MKHKAYERLVMSDSLLRSQVSSWISYQLERNSFSYSKKETEDKYWFMSKRIEKMTPYTSLVERYSALTYYIINLFVKFK